MKIIRFLAIFSLSNILINNANSEIVRGTVKGYYTNLYAIHATSDKRLIDFNFKCIDKYQGNLNNSFLINFIIDTDKPISEQFSTIQYDGYIIQLNARQKDGKYNFSSTNIPQYFSEDTGIKKINVSINHNFWNISSWMILKGGEEKSDAYWHTSLYSKHNIVKYNCVLSTEN